MLACQDKPVIAGRDARIPKNLLTFSIFRLLSKYGTERRVIPMPMLRLEAPRDGDDE
jgi:hypothetical protein